MVHDTTNHICKKIKVTSDFFTITNTECYLLLLLLLLSPDNLFTFLPLNAILPLLANNLGQLLHFS